MNKITILLGSENPSKKASLEEALKELYLDNYEIIPFKANSGVSSKPIGYEIIRGAENRNLELKRFAEENNIQYDYLCSIEGGFSLDENGLPFVVTYCVIEDILGNKSTGKSLGIRITRAMYDYVRDGGSLNEIIEEIEDKKNNKQKKGIMGYLSNGLCTRDKIDKDSVVSSFIPFIYRRQREELDNYVKEKIIKKK